MNNGEYNIESGTVIIDEQEKSSGEIDKPAGKKPEVRITQKIKAFFSSKKAVEKINRKNNGQDTFDSAWQKVECFKSFNIKRVYDAENGKAYTECDT